MVSVNGYTENEINYIKDNYLKYTNKEIAEYLGKNINSISYVARKIGLLKQPHKAWNEEEDNYLMSNYLEMSSEAIANELGRTVPSINARCKELNLIKHEAWSNEEIDYLVKHYTDMEHREIGILLGRSEGSVRAKCFELNLYKKELPWTNDEIEFLNCNYFQMAKNEIAEILNRSPSAVSLKASRLGLKKYPYHCDYHYFDDINTEEKAYWLGFITADGWINRNDDTNSGVVGIELQYKDIGHLRKFNKSIDGNYYITDRWRKCLISTNPDKLHHMCMIRIFSIIMYDTLCKYGFSNNKTFSIRFPKLKDDLYRHYIRGLFDADGGFCLSNKSFGISYITASEELKNDLVDYIRLNNIEIHDYSYINKCGTVMYVSTITKNEYKIKFLDYIYQDANIYLDRKYKKYVKAKEKFNSSNGLAAQK